MRRSVHTVLNYVFSAGLTVLFLYLAFRGTDFRKLVQSMEDANYWWMLLMLVFLLLSHVLRALRWRYFLEPIKPGIGLRNLFSGVMIGYFFNNVLPRAGEVARPYAIRKLEAVSTSAAFGTIVIERILDVVSFLLLVLLLPLLYSGPLTESFPWLIETEVLVSVATGVLLFLLVLFTVRRDWTTRVVRVLTRVLPSGLALRVERSAHAFLDGFLFLKRPRRFVAITVLSVLIWFLYIVMMYAAFFAYGLQDQLDFRAAVIVQAISSIGVVLPTPGGTGTYHAFTSQSLSKLFGVDATTALSYATVTHAVGFIGVTAIGLYYVIRDRLTVSEAVKTAAEGT